MSKISKFSKNMAKKSKKKQNKLQIFFKNNQKKIYVISTILIVLAIISAGIYSKQSKIAVEKRKEISKLEHKINQLESDIRNELASDIVLGDRNAKVTLIEYASLSCPHCANFHTKILSKIKKDYVDKGKVKVIYRDFPLNQSAMLASLISTCHARNNNNDSKKYYTLINVLFSTQDSWAFDKNFFEKLRSLAKLDGMTTTQFENCVNDEKIINEILEKRAKAANELGIKSTPSFLINGKFIGGYKTYKEFKEIIDHELQIVD